MTDAKEGTDVPDRGTDRGPDRGTDRGAAFWLERVALGELELDAEGLTAHGLDRADAEARLERLRAEDAEFRRALDGSGRLAEIGARLDALARESLVDEAAGLVSLDRAREARRRRWTAGVALAATVLLAVGAARWWRGRENGGEPVVALAEAPHAGTGEAETTTGGGVEVGHERIKGTTELSIRARDDEGERELEPGDHANSGDLLQLAYRAGEARSGVIVSIDGAGSSTLHFPSELDGSTRLSPRGRVSLPYAFELDDAPNYERFFFVHSRGDADIDAAVVYAAAEKLAASGAAANGELELPGGWTQIAFDVRKD